MRDEWNVRLMSARFHPPSGTPLRVYSPLSPIHLFYFHQVKRSGHDGHRGYQIDQSCWWRLLECWSNVLLAVAECARPRDRPTQSLCINTPPLLLPGPRGQASNKRFKKQRRLAWSLSKNDTQIEEKQTFFFVIELLGTLSWSNSIVYPLNRSFFRAVLTPGEVDGSSRQMQACFILLPWLLPK